jgi:hypothetical protein
LGPAKSHAYKRIMLIAEMLITEIRSVQNIGLYVGTGQSDAYKRNMLIAEMLISEVDCIF